MTDASRLTRREPSVDEIAAHLAALGVTIERAEIEVLRPQLLRLFRRLDRIAATLADEVPPQPGGGSRFSR